MDMMQRIKMIKMDMTQRSDFGTRYAAAWSSQNPAQSGGVLCRKWIPDRQWRCAGGRARGDHRDGSGIHDRVSDMVVKMDLVSRMAATQSFVGRGPVRTRALEALATPFVFSGYEEWTIGADGLIAESKGHFDEAEYQRQLKSGAPSAY